VLRADPSSAFQPDLHGSYPVHVAASADSMASIVVLLTWCPGCARLRDGRGRTFLHVAVERKRHHVLSFVRRWCQQPSTSSVLNIQDGDGNTALHLAVIAAERNVVRYLIGNRGVHINLQNKEGKTPMDLAQGKVQYGFYFGLVKIKINTLLVFFHILDLVD
jgi:ankyrin repeat protein